MSAVTNIIHILYIKSGRPSRYDAQTILKGGNATWGAHREGQHARFSGRHFLNVHVSAINLEAAKKAREQFTEAD